MAEESPRTISATVLKAFQEIVETNKEILKLFEVIEERRRHQEESVPGLRGETKQEKAQRATSELQNVQLELIAKLTSTNEEQTTKKSNVVEQVVKKTTLKVDKSLDSGVNADHKTNKEVRNSNKSDETGDTQLVNDVEKENEKACSADRNAGVTDQSLLTNEQKIFGQCLKSRKSIPLIRDNRFQTALDNGVVCSVDSASNTTCDAAQKESTDTVTRRGKETVSNADSKLQEAFSSDTEKGEVNENTINDGTVKSKEVINLGDAMEISDEEIQRQLENLETIPHREPEEKERVIIDIEKWDEYANEEVNKGRLAKEMHLNGSDTIFCLDISMSMKGEPLKYAKAFVHNYIEDLQSTEVTDETYEHVALVTFGHETKVQHHLSYEYFELLTKLEQVRAEGPSPLFAGFKMCWAALVGAGVMPSSPDDEIHPKVYLLTNDHVTPSSFIAGPDICTQEEGEMELTQVIDYCVYLSKEFNLIINGVSFKDSDKEKNTAFCANLKKAFNLDVNIVYVSIADKNLKDTKAKKKGELKASESLLFETETSENDDNMREECGTQGNSIHEDSDELYSSIESDADERQVKSQTNFPPRGARVKRKGDQLLGTVIKSYMDAITVTWDEARRDGDLTENILEPVSIEIVNQPRLLKDELIAIGCRVKRGPDWCYDNQDGTPGSEGTVYKVLDTGSVKVVWVNGYSDIYRFGEDGMFDLEILKAEPPVHIDNPSTNKAVSRMAHKAANTAQVKGSAVDMVMSEAIQSSEKALGATSSQSFTWRWKDSAGSWKTYPDDLNKHIEASYCDNPHGHFLFSYFDIQYKIMFKRMAKLEVTTGEKYPVSRRQL